MDFRTENLDIRTETSIDKNCLYLSFKGCFTELSSFLGANAITKELESKPLDFFVMIWDCTHMQDFELGARREWYKLLKKYSHRISDVTVISDKTIIRGAARVMLELFGLKSRIISSVGQLLDEID